MRLLCALLVVATIAAPIADGSRVFTDVTAASGIRFRHQSGAFGRKYLPETMGSGGAFLDVDGDGWLDVLLVNSKMWPGRPGPRTRHALFRNNTNGTFTDVTAASGLGVEMYGMGVAAADYDNDGYVDVYITGLDGNRLFRGTGGGRFVDVTARAGVGASGFSTSAAWLDYDADGRLDLFVARYVEWSVEKDLFCTLDGKTKSYCTPESYRGQSGMLFRNRGDGTFEDVTRAAGLHDPTAKALGVALLDFDGDGRIDLFVANDTQPNRLYRNRGNGTFVDVGVTAGVAFNEAGVARAGMGVDAADVDDSGRPSLVIGNFSNEMMALYVNEGNGLFIDEAPASTIGRASLLTLAFACFFFDYDLDGLLDIFAANGHVADDISRVQPRVSYAQPPHLFRQTGKRRFEDMSARAGADFARPMVARGAAYGDYDRDGDPDLLVTTNNGPARLLRNDGAAASAVRVALRGRTSNRDAVGATVMIRLAGGVRRTQMVRTGSSYLSQSELPLTFGLGPSGVVESAEVTWPGGRVETLGALAAGHLHIIEEGRGIVERIPFSSRASATTTGPWR
ncbi:MAG: CRTAC1 family protein [Vicinamibacterales bacterium]